MPRTTPPLATASVNTRKSDRSGEIADVHDLHAEPQVGLVAAVAGHGVRVGQPRERPRQLDAERLLEGGREHALHHLLDVLLPR